MLAGFAGEYATQKGVTGWGAGNASTAALICFNDWLRRRGGAGSGEIKALLSQVKYFFEQHAEGRFLYMDAEYWQKGQNTAGYRRKNKEDEWEYLVYPEVFNKELIKGFDSSFAMKALKERGWITPGADGKYSQSLRLNKKGTTRAYVFTSKLWEASTD